MARVKFHFYMFIPGVVIWWDMGYNIGLWDGVRCRNVCFRRIIPLFSRGTIFLCLLTKRKSGSKPVTGVMVV